MDEFSDVFCVMRFGDDLGFKSPTLLSPDDIRTHILRSVPPYNGSGPFKRQALPAAFLRQSFEIFDDIIEIANIDAKHSNEDEIGHFTVWVERYGDRIANFGGIDTDVLCRHSPITSGNMLQITEQGQRARRNCIRHRQPIPDYVPTEGYLAMIETVREWRQDELP